jgi:glucose/arabinose dehydrogenase
MGRAYRCDPVLGRVIATLPAAARRAIIDAVNTAGLLPRHVRHAGLVRRSAALVAALVFAAALGAGGVAAAGVRLAVVASGLDHPVLVTNARDGTNRLFVVEQPGRIRIIKAGVLLPTPFLDISDGLSKGAEQGLLGLAFHPDFRHNGRFYVDFTRADGDTAINEYRVSADPDVASKRTGRRIITIDQPFANHNGGGIAFGPDGYLWIGMGDGGGAGDPGNRARDLNSLLGKMLRIDVNRTSIGHNYRIPRSNPYVGRFGRDEIWSSGLRNPWRWSFDRVTGDLWIGDVGQDRYEEIDRSSTASGRGRGVDYGWRVMEGNHCYRPGTGCTTRGKILPIVEYSHREGCSVIGGYVYRGASVPALGSRYVFGDLCSGAIWTIPKGALRPATKVLLMDTDLQITSFGEDERGELYVMSLAGTVYRFEAT